MKYNTQNAKIASITEETLVLGIDVGSATHYVRAFDWRNYEFSDKEKEWLREFERDKDVEIHGKG